MQHNTPTLNLRGAFVRFTLCALCLSIIPFTIFAETFVVNSTWDTHDANLEDGVCRDAHGKCTFRAALEQANYLDNATYSEPHIIDMSGLKEEVLLSLGEVPPMIHIRLVGDSDVEVIPQKAFSKPTSARFTREIFYPNPAWIETTLDLRRFNSEALSVVIIDELGYPVEEFDFEGFSNVRVSLDLSNYDSGVYWVKIKQAEDKSYLKKLTVVNYY